MSIKKIVQKLDDELNGMEREKIIKSYIELLSQNVVDLSDEKSFFCLPLSTIFKVISNVDFAIIEENIEIIQKIIKNTINIHKKEKETILFLQNIDISNCNFTFEEIMEILDCFTNCSLLSQLCKLYHEKDQYVVYDYEYEIQEKNKIIKELESKFPVPTPPPKQLNEIPVKPWFLEKDIFQACKKGKLDNVKYFIEIKNINPLIQDNEGDSLIHICCHYGYLPIVKYLIENQNVDKDLKGNTGKSPLHIATLNNQLQIVSYLVNFASANPNSRMENGQTPLHLACITGSLPIVKILVENGNANINAKDNTGYTPLSLADLWSRIPIVNYLTSKGAQHNY